MIFGYSDNWIKGDETIAIYLKRVIRRFFFQDMSERRFNIGTPIYVGIVSTILLSSLDSTMLFFRDVGNYGDYLYLRGVTYHPLLIFGTIIFLTGPSVARFRILLVLVTSAVAFSMLFYVILLTPETMPEYAFEQNGLIIFLFSSYLVVDRRWSLVCATIVLFSIIFAAFCLLPRAEWFLVAWNLMGMYVVAIVVGAIMDDFRSHAETIILNHKDQIGGLRTIGDFNFNILKQANHALYARRADGKLIVNFLQKEFENFNKQALDHLFSAPEDKDALPALFDKNEWNIQKPSKELGSNVINQIIIQNDNLKTFVASMMRLPDNSLGLLIMDMPLPHGDIRQISQGFAEFGVSIFEFNKTKKLIHTLGGGIRQLTDIYSFDQFMEVLYKSGLNKNDFYLGKRTLVNIHSVNFWVQHNSPSLLDDSHGFQVMLLKANELPVSSEQMKVKDLAPNHSTILPLYKSPQKKIIPSKSFSHICLVDDNLALLKSLGHLLRLAGINVDLVASCDAFWKNIAMGADYQLIFMDFHISEYSGIELGREILELNPSARCVLFSGEITADEEAFARSSGFADTLIKPIGLEQIKEIINKYAP